MPDNERITQPRGVGGDNAPSEFDRFFNSTPSPMVVAGSDGHVDRVNLACELLAGYAGDELRGRPFLDFIHPDDREAAQLAILEMIASGVGQGVDLRVVCKDGTYKWTEWVGTPFSDQQLFYLVGKDVSVRHAAQDTLAERVKQQATIAELGRRALAAGDLASLMEETVTLIAQTLNVEFAEIRELASNRHETILKAGIGWHAGPLGQPPISVDPDTVSGYMLSNDQSVVIADLRCETRFHGSEILRQHKVVSGVGCVIYGPEGPFGVLAAYSNRLRSFNADDIGFLQAAASVLSAAITRQRAVDDFDRFFDSSADLMVIAGFDGRVRRMNSPPGAENYLTAEAVQDQPFLKFFHPDDQERVARELEKLLAVGTVQSLEARCPLRDGGYNWFSWSATAFPDRQILYAVGQNTTARHRAEEELRRFFDNSSDALAICGFDGSFKRFNPACIAISGFSADDLEHMPSFLDTVHPDDRAAAAAEIQKLRAGGKLSAFEIRSLNKDGTYSWISWNITAFVDWQEYYITGHVVTDRHIAEEALRQHARQQEAVAELGSRILGAADLPSIMADAAAVLARTLEIEYSEVLELQAGEREVLLKAGYGWPERQIGSIRASADPENASGYILATKQPLVIQDLARETRFAGSPILKEHQAVSGMGCLIPAAGLPYGVLGVHSSRRRTFSADDVHFLEAIANILAAAIERKRGELERERFFDRTLTPMLIIGFDGIVKYVNAAASSFSGYAREELLGGQYLSLIHSDDIGRAAENLPDLIAGKSFHDVELRIRRKDESYRWLALDSSPDPERQAFYVIAHDVSDRHLAEEALSQRARQQEAIAALGNRALASGDLPALLNDAAAVLAQTLEAEFADVFELQEGERSFLLAAGYGWREEQLGRVRAVASADDVNHRILTFKQPAIIDELHPDFAFPKLREFAEQQSASGMACLIQEHGRPWGILGVRSIHRRTYSGDDLHFVEAVGNTLSAAIERRRAEEELNRFFEPSLNPMFIGGYDGLIKRYNEALELMIGAAREEMLSRQIASFVHPDDRQSVAAQIQKLVAGELAESFSCRIVHKDGSQRWTLWNAKPFPEYQVFYATGQDLTQLRVAEESLRASEETLRATDESAIDGIVLLDGEGKVAHWNAAAQRIFGFSNDEIIGRDLHSTVVPPEERERFEQGWGRFRQTGQGEFIGKVKELEGLRKDGSRFPLEVSVAAVLLHGRWNAVGVIRDITARKRQEAELIAAREAAEAASRAKSEFLANMSHEIRTPMNGVIGLTSLVLDTPLSKEQRQYLDGVMLSAESLLKIINDILDFSKIEAGRMELEKIDFDLRETLGNTMQTLALRAHEKGLELTYDIRPEVPDSLVGDPARLWQVLVNLVGNAIKFTHQGEVDVTVAVETLQPDAACLHFTISDTGIGIPTDKQQTLFRPFSQVDSSMSRKYGGTGLGLAISAQIVEMMKGRIWFESELGQGSTFHFTAWFDRRTTPLPKRAPLPPSALDGLRVLAVDDNATNRTILHDMLTHWGMKPAESDDGIVAINAMQEAFKTGEPFALILLDVMMPGMDGFQVLEQIRKMPEIARPVIMMLSSRDQPGDAARAHELGASAYIVKPIRPSELLNAIMKSLDISFEPIDSRPAGVPPSIVSSPRGTTLRILIAEDNAINQMLAVRLLEKAGHSVAVANNGEEALAAIGREKFDVVLMDVQMPVMDGFEATALVRQQEKTTGCHLPIVAMTAHAMKGDREKCLAAGMDGYVAKPVQKDELFAAITAATVVPLSSS